MHSWRRRRKYPLELEEVLEKPRRHLPAHATGKVDVAKDEQSDGLVLSGWMNFVFDARKGRASNS